MKVYIKFLVFDFLQLLRCLSLIIICVGKKNHGLVQKVVVLFTRAMQMEILL